MVNLDTFKKCIKHIQAQQEKDDILSDTLVCEDTSGWISTAGELIDDLIDLLADNMTGEEAKDWICWYLWEIDMDKPEPIRGNHVWVPNEEEGVGYKYTINDAEDLYYLITDKLSYIKEKVQEEPPKTRFTFNNDSEPVNSAGETLYDIFMKNMNTYTETEN